MAKDKQKHAGQQFKTMPTLDELRAMFPKDRKAYLDSLDPESRAALFQHICADLPEPATEEEVDAELFGVKDAFSVVRDLIRGNVYPNIGNDAELRKHFSSLPADKRVDAITKWDDVTMAYVTQRQRKMLKRLNEIGTNKKIAEIHKDVKETKAAAECAVTQSAETRQDFANLGDELSVKFGERTPPKPKEVDSTSRRALYDLTRRVVGSCNTPTKKHNALEKFLDKSTWRFEGWTVREIYKDYGGLQKFIHAECVAIAREQKANS